jgi:hypothetical protein
VKEITEIHQKFLIASLIHNNDENIFGGHKDFLRIPVTPGSFFFLNVEIFQAIWLEMFH